MQSNHFIALQNVHLKIKLKKLEAEMHDLELNLSEINKENYEICENLNQAEDNLMMRIQKESDFYIEKIQEIEQ